MNPAVKKLWEDALTSGKYKQGVHRLYNPGTGCHCALGVLCEVAIEHGVEIQRASLGGYVDTCAGKAITAVYDTGLPKHVAAWAGLFSYSPYIAPHGDRGPNLYITHMNDNERQTFKTIGEFLKTVSSETVK